MIKGYELIEKLYSDQEEEKLYSTGDPELDDLLEKAFCEGYEYAQKEFAKYILVSLGIIVLSTLVSTYMFDRSSDGNTYHKDAIGVMKEGFNPVYEESYDFIVKRDGNDNYSQYNIWTDHYAKNNWIIEANIYKFTNNIESAKAINLISAYIAFGIIFTILSSTKIGYAFLFSFGIFSSINISLIFL